ERSTRRGRMSRPGGTRIHAVIGGSQRIPPSCIGQPVLSTLNLTPSWSSARSRKAQGSVVVLDTPTVEERAWGQGPRLAHEQIDGGPAALLQEGCGRFLHVRRTLSRGARLVLARIACFMVQCSVTDTMALFCSESTFAPMHVATEYIRCSCAGY